MALCMRVHLFSGGNSRVLGRPWGICHRLCLEFVALSDPINCNSYGLVSSINFIIVEISRWTKRVVILHIQMNMGSVVDLVKG